MRRSAVVLVAALLLAPASAFASYTASYGWEDGGTSLGLYGSNIPFADNVTGPRTGFAGDYVEYAVPGANSGTRFLHTLETPHTGTPQVFLAWVTGLVDGDTVDASFFGYDLSPGLSPSLRIWGHYTDDSTTSYTGSAGGNSTYTAGTGWDQVAHSFTFTDSGDDYALMIEARLYSYPSTSTPNRTDFWIDDIEVTVPDHATVHFAPEPTSLVMLALGGFLAIRRRR